ncbi:MFS transporter [Nocardioides aequoreus]|uniref:MFS transporter n=1 Tax=Nocardioides aequoreus TaxID=397278 RepID=UPI00055C75B9|nr:MFS transporter [Nocardioides aequoreus]
MHDHPTEATAGRRAPRLLRPFRRRGYRRLALAMALTTFTAGVWVVAMVWEVIRIGGGPTQLSLVMTAMSVGVLVPALLAGAVADRVPQKRILQGVSGVELLTIAVVALLSLSDATRLWHLALASLALGVAMAFYFPAYSAWLPALVEADELQAVNGFEGMVRPVLQQAAGPAAAGVVVGAVSSGAAVAVAAVVSLAGLLAVSLVPLTAVRRDLSAEPPGHVVVAALRDIGQGFGYMVRTPWLLATLLFASLMVLVFIGPLEVLVPFLVKDQLGGGPGDHATVLAMFGVGGAVGSLAMGALPLPRRYLTWMNLLWGVGCLPMVAIGLATALWQVYVAAFVLGLGFSAPMVIWGTLLQRRVPPELLGRVSSLDFFVSLAFMPVSMALAGPVSELLGLVETFVVAGVAPVVFAVVAVLWARMPADELAHPLDGPAERPQEVTAP